jgi:hypothetical protein
MATIHQLALFWRSQQARAMTTLHFTLPEKESAPSRAQSIVSALEQLTTLQIYGAALETTPLQVDLIKLAPLSGTEERLEVNLYPDAPIAPRHGVVPISFSIWGPNQQARSLTQNPQQQQAWHLLEKELLPFICLLVGAHVSPKANPIKRIELVTVSEERQPQPDEPPVDDAIAATERKIASASAQFAQLRRRGEEPTQKDLERMKKYQDHLAWLSSLKQLEESFFATASARAPEPAIPLIPTLASLQLKAKEQNMTEVNTPQIEQEDSSAFLPASPQQPELWSDLPAEHFSSPHYWLSGEAIRKEFALSERSYFRWIDALKQHGLQRQLPARTRPKLKLFYRPDLEQARSSAQESGAFRKPGRPVEKTTTTPKPTTPARQHSITAPSTDNRVASRFEQDMMAKFDTLLQQQHRILEQLTSLSSNLLNQPNVTDVIGRAFDLLNNFGQFNSLASQLMSRLDKIESRLHTLPASIAKTHTKKIKSKSKLSKKK